MAGNLPGGWSCSASLACCYRGEVGGSDEYLRRRRTTYRQLGGAVVLGGKFDGTPTGESGGTPAPDVHR
jgi:hypothetical protein